jgi:hypothetical protein
MGRASILAAVSSSSLPLLRELLPWGGLFPVFTLRDALERARSGEIDAVLIGLHFDGSRMPLLLEALKSDPATRGIPVVCCQLQPTILPDATLRAARVLCDALGAEEFVDLLALHDWAGQAAAAARLKFLLQRARRRRGSNRARARAQSS